MKVNVSDINVFKRGVVSHLGGLSRCFFFHQGGLSLVVPLYQGKSGTRDQREINWHMVESGLTLPMLAGVGLGVEGQHG